MSKRLMVLGSGGHGKSVAEAALLGGEWTEILFFDDAWPTTEIALGWPVCGKIEDIVQWVDQCEGAIAAVGNNAVRQLWTDAIEQAGLPLITVVHPKAWVSPSAMVAKGVAVMAGAVVGTISSVGEGAIVNSNATVDHDVVMGEFAHLGVGVHLAGGVKVGAGAWLQAGSSCGYNVVIEAGALYGPGTSLG